MTSTYMYYSMTRAAILLSKWFDFYSRSQIVSCVVNIENLTCTILCRMHALFCWLHWSSVRFHRRFNKKCRVNVESFALIIIYDLLFTEFTPLIILYICKSRTFSTQFNFEVMCFNHSIFYYVEFEYVRFSLLWGTIFDFGMIELFFLNFRM